jgi:hypothetical protein
MKEGEKGELQSKAEARYTVEAYYKGLRLLLTLPLDGSPALAAAAPEIVRALDKCIELGIGQRTEGVIYQAPPETKAEAASPASPEHKEADNGKENGNFCPIHQTEMRKFEKNGKSWFSHNVNGQWCNGKKK